MWIVSSPRKRVTKDDSCELSQIQEKGSLKMIHVNCLKSNEKGHKRRSIWLLKSKEKVHQKWFLWVVSNQRKRVTKKMIHWNCLKSKEKGHYRWFMWVVSSPTKRVTKDDSCELSQIQRQRVTKDDSCDSNCYSQHWTMLTYSPNATQFSEGVRFLPGLHNIFHHYFNASIPP